MATGNKRELGEAHVSETKRSKLSDDWPIVLSGNRVLWSSKQFEWSTNVETVILGKEQVCNFVYRQNVTWTVTFATTGSVFKIGGVQVESTDPDITHFAHRATMLCNHCTLLSSEEPQEFVQHTRKAVDPKLLSPDSDDDQLPDYELPEAFSKVELNVINYLYIKLWYAFQQAKAKSFQNQAGKEFFTDLGNYLIMVYPFSPAVYKFKSTHSTNPKGDAQPGACSILMSIPKITTKSTNPDDTSDLKCRMTADYVLYNKQKDVCCVVGEVKGENEDAAESQNITQMVASFRENQSAMLGFTANPNHIVPRFLWKSVADDIVTLTLSMLKKIDMTDTNAVLWIAKLFMAFVTIV